MKKSLIVIAAMAAMGETLTLAEGESPPKALTDDQLPEAGRDLVLELEKIALEAPHASDPREPAKRIAAVLAAYFRTPD